MAIFTNQATLTYNGVSTNSNVAYGEILDVLSATKTAIEGSYTPNELVTYAITLRNTGSTALTGLTLTDDLGGYDFSGTTVYPLTYEESSVTVFTDGILQPLPAVTAGPPLVINGISVPANGDVVIIYQARVNNFANPTVGGTIDNTVNITGNGLSSPVTATESVSVTQEALLSISKSITPSQVTDNERVTYTFVISNLGNEAVVSTDDTVITDTFNPALSDIVVSFEGNVWTLGTQYNYNEATGLFTTVAGQIVVPAASYTQDTTTGEYSVTPGVATLEITGTI